MTKEYKNVIQDLAKSEADIRNTGGTNSIIPGQIWVAEDTLKMLYRNQIGNVVDIGDSSEGSIGTIQVSDGLGGFSDGILTLTGDNDVGVDIRLPNNLSSVYFAPNGSLALQSQFSTISVDGDHSINLSTTDSNIKVSSLGVDIGANSGADVSISSSGGGVGITSTDADILLTGSGTGVVRINKPAVGATEIPQFGQIQTLLNAKANLTGGNQFTDLQSITATGAPDSGTSIWAMKALGDTAYKTMFQTNGDLVFGTGVSGQFGLSAVLSRKSAATMQIGTNQIVVEGDAIITDAKYNISEITRRDTGWEFPELVDMTYDPASRTVSVFPKAGTPSITAYWRGRPVLTINAGTPWVSPAHTVPSGQQSFYLFYNGTNYVFQTTPWTGFEILISWVWRDGVNFCLRECHGFQDPASRLNDHRNTGTYLVSGGFFSDFTLNSTTATHRRPHITEVNLADEDCPSVLPALATDEFTRMWLTGVAVSNASVDNIDFLSVGASGRPVYNRNNAGTWDITTEMANNEYAKWFVLAIPVSSSVACQKVRFTFVQAQKVSATLATIQAVAPSSINLGSLGVALPEFCFIGEIIVRATTNNWQLISVTRITGSRVYQIGQSTTVTSLPASAIVVTPTGNITSTDAQAALAELDLEKRNQTTETLNVTSVIADRWYTILDSAISNRSNLFVAFEINANYEGVGGANGRVAFSFIGDIGVFRASGLQMLNKSATTPIKAIRSCYVSGGTSRIQVQMRGTYSTVTTIIRYMSASTTMSVLQYRDDSAESLIVLDTIDIATGGLQSQSVALTALGSITPASDTMGYFNGTTTALSTPLTSFGRSLLDDPDATTARTTLGAQGEQTALNATQTVGYYELGYVDLLVNTSARVHGIVKLCSRYGNSILIFSVERSGVTQTITNSNIRTIHSHSSPEFPNDDPFVQWEVLVNNYIRVHIYARLGNNHGTTVTYQYSTTLGVMTNAKTSAFFGTTRPTYTDIVGQRIDNPCTSVGDLTVNGTGNIPVRLAIPTANDQALVLNTAGTNIEWKTTFILNYRFSRTGWLAGNYGGGDVDLPYAMWTEDAATANHAGRGVRATVAGRITAVTFQFDPSYMGTDVTAYIKKNGTKTNLGTVTSSLKYATFNPTNYTFEANDEILFGFTGTSGQSYGYPTATAIIRNLI